MTTNGGGWVLIARGRKGWTFSPSGQGSPATIRDTPNGPNAFAPAALDTTTINGLINNTNLSTLPDGIRLERATTTDGTARQDYRLYPKARTWTWNLSAAQILNKIVIDGTTFNGSNTYDTASSVTGQSTNQLSTTEGTKRLFTFRWTSHQNQAGFSFGTGVNGGSNRASNYLWTAGTEGSPLPFTQVWLRPQIDNSVAGFAPIPVTGFAPEAKVPSLKNRSELAPWGVTGYNHTDEASVTPWQANVMAVKAYGDRVYVGGRFTGVQQGPTATPIAQRTLAAFDLDGNWISTFRPTIDGRVWDMTMTDDGKLIIGGDFTSVDGVAGTSGLAALDPITGAVSNTWNVNLGSTNGRALVRGLDLHDGWIYATGRFNTVKGGTSNVTTTTNAINVSAATGNPGNWRPQIFASAVRVRAAAAGDRVYLAGFFNSVNGDTNQGFYGITDATTGAVVPGIGPYLRSTGTPSTNAYQQAVAESGDNILVGGAQHTFQMYDHNRTNLIDSHITKSGGDFQAIETYDGYAYASCHCMNRTYSGTNNWSSPQDFRAVDPIRMIGRWNATTFEYDTTWYPNGTKGTNDDGIWTISQDSRKCLWVGGDLVRGAYSGNAATDYLGGFARFCPTDAVVPTTPTNLSATVSGSEVGLAWGASTDSGGTISYDVYRNDRVIATVYGTSYTDTTTSSDGGPSRYTVRAADPRGNRSASPAPITINGSASILATPIAFGSSWRYLANGTDLGTGWRNRSFDDSAFSTGAAALGWDGTQATTIGGGLRPVTSYFRTTFDVVDASQVKLLELQARVAQGAALYVNGVEVGRTNLPAGALQATTSASSLMSAAEEARAKAYGVPGSLLVTGQNTLAVEVHSWTAATSKVFLDLQATTRGSTTDQLAPSAPTLSLTGVTAAVALSWTPSTDETGVAGYQVVRDGTIIAIVGPLATTYTDAVDTTVNYAYVVRAFDAAGNLATSNTRETLVAVNPNLLAFGSTWTWWYQTAAPIVGWKGENYDTTGWQSGPGELGFGDTPKATLTTTTTGSHPLTSYYRANINIDNPTDFSTMALDLIRNAGAVVYVNGVEVGRSNMPTGPITSETYAGVAPATTLRHIPVRLIVASSAFRTGANTIAVEVHLNYRSQPTSGFDLKITGLP